VLEGLRNDQLRDFFELRKLLTTLTTLAGGQQRADLLYS
jgi:hypothetical protein